MNCIGIVMGVILLLGPWLSQANASENVREQRIGLRITAPIGTEVTSQTVDVGPSQRLVVFGSSLAISYDPTEAALSSMTSVIGGDLVIDVTPDGILDGCAMECTEVPNAMIDLVHGTCTDSCPVDPQGQPRPCTCAHCFIVCPECDWWDILCKYEAWRAEAGFGGDGELRSLDLK